jgi:WbqC-like protein family
MPLEKAPRDVLIRDLRFRAGARDEIDTQIRRFPALANPSTRVAPLVDAIRNPGRAPVDYIVDLVRLATEIMGLPWRTLRSSELGLCPDLRGQDRILAIAKACGAGRYVNPPGGRELYQHVDFAAAGIELRFLKDYEGSYDSIAQRLSAEDPASVANEIRTNTIWTA